MLAPRLCLMSVTHALALPFLRARLLLLQAAELLQLFTFIRADLDAYKPQPRDALTYGESSMGLSAEGFGEPSSTVSPSPSPSSEPHFPKSLYLIKPLFGAYELNAVALSAQASVPVPEGLDLDAWIVPFQEEPSPARGDTADETLEGKKGKKGKRKDGSSKSKRKGKSRAQDDVDENGDRNVDGNGYGEAAQPIETEEERAERERVSVELVLGCHFSPLSCSPHPRRYSAPVFFCSTCICVLSSLTDDRGLNTQTLQRKAERLERLREDPYYLMDDRPPPRLGAADIESIPVVKLDDLPPLGPSTGTPRSFT